MPTYTIDYLNDPTVNITTNNPVGLTDQAPDPEPQGDFTTYKHDNKTVMEIVSTSDTVAFTISPPAGAGLEDQGAEIELAIGTSKETTVEWTTPGSVRLDIKADTVNTDCDLMRADDRPIVRLRLKVHST